MDTCLVDIWIVGLIHASVFWHLFWKPISYHIWINPECWLSLKTFVTDGHNLFVCLPVHIYIYVRLFGFSSSLLWIHWGSTLMWLLTASQPERQMWSFAPTKMLWQPCPKTRTTCVRPPLSSLAYLYLCGSWWYHFFYATLCNVHDTKRLVEQ